MPFNGEKLRLIRENAGKTRKELELITGKKTSNCANWELGRSQPTISDLIIIAKYLNVSLEYLLDEPLPENKGIKKDETKIPSNAFPIEPYVLLPIFGTISAGNLCIAEQIPEGWEPVRIESIKSDIKNYFFLTVDGDSMSGIGIFHKSLVLVHKQETVNNNEVAVVMANGDEATVKRVRFIENEMVMLIPENNAFSPQFYHRNDIHICGKVEEVISKIY
jgi:repressor LexA